VTAGGRLLATLCAAEVLTMVGVFAFPALLPGFVAAWDLSSAEAGWIAGGYFVGYAVAAVVLLTLTDRLDARRIYLGGALATAAGAAAFALFANGFWTALVLRFLAGIGLAATYLPGLRVLVDRYRGDRPSRAVSTYTASFGLGTALSFLVAGELAGSLGWRAAFAAAAGAAVVAFALVRTLPPARPARAAAAPTAAALRDALANRPAMGYVLAYGIHCWELFVLRSWQVAFLAASLGLTGAGRGAWPSPTAVATLCGLVSMAASIGGNELCVRFGRRRTIALVMVVSAATAFGIGATVSWSYTAAVAGILAYTVLVMADSGALTAGAVEAAAPDRRGATLALHALIGFGCAGLGPPVFGVVLDLADGSADPHAWWLAFAATGLVALTGPLALRLGRG
jgi:MFS family permease